MKIYRTLATMITFNHIYQRALDRKGEALLKEQTQVTLLSPEELCAIPDHRILSEITKAVFRAGFVWRVIEQKWPGFEEAFWSFNVNRCAHMSFEDMETLQKDTRIVRNRPKIESVQQNALMIQELENQYAGEYQSIGELIGRWPAEDYQGLIALFHKRGKRIGIQSAQYFLRFLGRDGYVIGNDGAAALIRAGIIEKAPTSIKAKRQVQEAFNQWTEETGYSQAKISRILALSIDA